MDHLITCAKCGEPIGVYEPSVVVHELDAERAAPQGATEDETTVAHYHLDCRFHVSVAGEDRHAA